MRVHALTEQLRKKTCREQLVFLRVDATHGQYHEGVRCNSMTRAEACSVASREALRIHSVREMNYFLTWIVTLRFLPFFLAHAKDSGRIVQHAAGANPPTQRLAPLKCSFGRGGPGLCFAGGNIKDSAMQRDYVRKVALGGDIPPDRAQSFPGMQMNQIEVRKAVQLAQQRKRKEITPLLIELQPGGGRETQVRVEVVEPRDRYAVDYFSIRIA